MAGAVCAAVQIAVLRRSALGRAVRRARDIPAPWRERGKDRVEMLHDACLAADHHAVAAFQPPHPAAGPDIDIVDPSRHQLLGAPDVVDVIGIAAVDQDVVGLERGQNVGDRLVDDRRRHHQPYRPRLLQFFDEIRERGRPYGMFRGELTDRFWRHVEDHALMASLEKPPDHVGAHPAEADHSELHGNSPLKTGLRGFFDQGGKIVVEQGSDALDGDVRRRQRGDNPGIVGVLALTREHRGHPISPDLLDRGLSSTRT